MAIPPAFFGNSLLNSNTHGTGIGAAQLQQYQNDMLRRQAELERYAAMQYGATPAQIAPVRKADKRVLLCV